MVKIIYYKRSTIDHAIYVKLFSDGTVSYLTVSMGDVLNTTNNYKVFQQLKRVFENNFKIKTQEGSFLKYPNYRILNNTLSLVLIIPTI